MLTEDSSASPPPEPWRSFLKELDELLKGPVELRCLGGFVITQQYGIGRETSDIDYLALAALSRDDNVEVLAGLGSKLHRKFHVYMQYMGIVTPPADYASRLIPMFPSARWSHLKLLALDATDLALSKLAAPPIFAALAPNHRMAGSEVRHYQMPRASAGPAIHVQDLYAPPVVPIAAQGLPGSAA